MRRVLHITTVPESLQFIAGQQRFMHARGYLLEAASSPGPDLDAFGEREGVPVHAVNMPRAITPRADLLTLARLTSLIREREPDIVHAHTPKGGLLGMLSAATARTRVRIYHMRGLPFMTARGWKRQLLMQTERVACASAHHVLCVSHSLRGVALAHHLTRASKIEVLLGGSGQGVDVRRFDPDGLPAGTRAAVRRELGIDDGATVVGFVGRLVRDKGIVELADAWRALRDGFPAARLVVAGRFEDKDALPPGVRHWLTTEPSVVLAGFRRDTERLYAAMDIVVLPTHREGFPNVPLEAAAMRLPMVATRIPGCLDAVVHEQTGLLVEAADARGLAAALERYLSDAALRSMHAATAQARARTLFARERIWAAIADTYDRLCAQRNTRAA